MNVWDNIPEVKRIIQDSTTYTEVFRRLGVSPDSPALKTLLMFMTTHKAALKDVPYPKATTELD